MSEELNPSISNHAEMKSDSQVMQPEWVFWVFGEPNLAQPQPIAKCLVHLDSIVFETHPLSPIAIGTILSCVMKRDGIGFSYNLYIDIQFKQPHVVFGEKLRFMLVDPNLAMWGNDRASDAEFRTFAQLINALKIGDIPDIHFNPYYRSYKASGTLIRSQDVEDAYIQPKAVKRPSLLLAALLIVVITGIMIFLGVLYR